MRLLAIAVLVLASASANAQIYKCTQGGKSTYSDRPCGENEKLIKAAPPKPVEVDYGAPYRAYEEALDASLRALRPAGTEQCIAEEAAPTVAQMDGIIARFADVERIAGTTSRIALATPLLELNRISAELKDMQPAPGCVAVLHRTAMHYVTNTIEGYRAFAGGTDNERMSRITLASAAQARVQYMESKRAFGL